MKMARNKMYFIICDKTTKKNVKMQYLNNNSMMNINKTNLKCSEKMIKEHEYIRNIKVWN